MGKMTSSSESGQPRILPAPKPLEEIVQKIGTREEFQIGVLVAQEFSPTLAAIKQVLEEMPHDDTCIKKCPFPKRCQLAHPCIACRLKSLVVGTGPA